MLGIGLGYSRGSAAAAAVPWYEDATTIPTSSGSATVTADPTAHTKGAYTEIIASNAAETSALAMRFTGVSQNAVDTATLVDIAIGAAGSEIVVVSDVAIGGAQDVYQVIPIKIASGARISARIQSVVTGGKTATVALDTFALGDASTVPTSVDVLGTSTATSEGTAVGGSYTEIVASTSTAYKAIGVIESVTAASISGGTVTFKVAVGAAGSEVEVHRKISTYTVSESFLTQVENIFWITAVDIPAGSRLSAIGIYEVTIIGVPA